MKYIQDTYRGNCTVTTVDAFGVDGVSDGTYIKLRDPEAFFNFDKGNFHYVGRVRRILNQHFDRACSELNVFKYQKKVGSVETDVWIGQKDYGNLVGTGRLFCMEATN